MGLGLFVLVGYGCGFGGWLRVVHPWFGGVVGLVGLLSRGVGCRDWVWVRFRWLVAGSAPMVWWCLPSAVVCGLAWCVIL